MPAHWDVRRIKTLFREVSRRKGDEEHVLLSLTRRHGLVPHNEVSDKLASAADHTNYKVCHQGNLVMNRMQAWSGMFAIPTLVGIVSPDYAIYEPTGPCELSYFEQLFKTRLMVDQFAQYSKGIGSGFNRLYTEVFGSIPTLVPPLHEQRAIARYLDFMDSRIQRYVRAKERLIELLEEQKRAVINQAVTRGLDPDVSLKPSGVEWLGDVPTHWEVRRLKHCGSATIGLTYSPLDVVSEGEGMLVLRASNVQNGRIVYEDCVYVNCDVPSKLIVRAGDILICSRSGSRDLVGKNAQIDAESEGVTYGAFMTVFRSEHNEFLHQVFNSELFPYHLGAFSTSTVNQLTLEILYGLRVPFPPVDERDQIIEFLRENTKIINQRIDIATKQIELIREYRTRLIADVVTGKLDVREAAAGLPEDEGDVDVGV